MIFTKEDRKNAVLTLLVEASTPDFTGNTYGTTEALGFDGVVNALAFRAWSKVQDAVAPGRLDDDPEIYAEAAQLLSEGWNPFDRDDKLVKLRGAL